MPPREDPSRRYQHIGDVRLALEEIDAAWEAPRPARSAWRRASLFILPAALTIAAAWLLFGHAVTPENSAPIPLTSFSGDEILPARSPDGRQVAFGWNGEKGDNHDIYVMQPGSTQTIRLTTDAGMDFGPAWSPDGLWIAYTHVDVDGKTNSLRVVSPLGGPWRTLLTLGEVMGRASWTPDSRSVFVDIKPPKQPGAIWVVTVESGGRRQLTRPRGLSATSCPPFHRTEPLSLSPAKPHGASPSSMSWTSGAGASPVGAPPA